MTLEDLAALKKARDDATAIEDKAFDKRDELEEASRQALQDYEAAIAKWIAADKALAEAAMQYTQIYEPYEATRVVLNYLAEANLLTRRAR